MQQAYQNFNSGKYKQSLNNLLQNPLNQDSYQPNLAITQYASNRGAQSMINCLKKLNDIMNRRLKRETHRLDLQTQSIMKFNVAVVLILLGKKDSALVVLEELYGNRDCFIEFMQTRIFLLLMELHTNLKNSVDVLNLYRFYLLKPVEQRAMPNQWTSVMLHEHSKASAVSREEFVFITKVLLNQAMIHLGVPPSALTSKEEDEKFRSDLLGRIKKRKNNINKYYEINVYMISRFLEAQKQLHSKSYKQSLSLMNFVNIIEQYQQMPTTKIITNILNAFATSNTGLIYFGLEKPVISVHHFLKAKTFLAKACTGVEDKDLQLFSINYTNHTESLNYNTALSMLAYKPQQSYALFEAIKRSTNISKNYKYWYRLGQSTLYHFHNDKVAKEQKQVLLQSALRIYSNCLICLDEAYIPFEDELKKLTKTTTLNQEDIDTIIFRLKTQQTIFRQNVLSLLCYICLGLKLYHRVLTMGKLAMQDKKLTMQNKINIACYMVQACLELGKEVGQFKKYLDIVEKECHYYLNERCEVYCEVESGGWVEVADYQTVVLWEKMVVGLKDCNLRDALSFLDMIRMKKGNKVTRSLKESMKYMHSRIGLDPKFVSPYLPK